MKRYLPLVLFGLIVASFGVRLYMTQLWGWLLFYEVPLLLLFLAFLFGLTLYLVIMDKNRFPAWTTSGLVALYFLAAIFAGDISDEAGVYYFGSFHSTDYGESIFITEQISFFMIFVRSAILLALTGVFIYGAVKKRKV